MSDTITFTKVGDQWTCEDSRPIALVMREPDTSIRGYVKSGQNGTTWDGVGILSSVAEVPPEHEE